VSVPSRRRTTRLLAAGGGVLLAAAALTACGGDSSDGASSAGTSSAPSASASASAPAELTPVQRVAAAADSVSTAGTARFTIEVSAKVAGQDQKTAGEGVVDAASGAAQITMTVPGVNTEIEVIAIDDAIYMRGMPGQPADKWHKMDAQTGAAMGGLNGSSADPTQTLEMLRTVGEGVQEAGTETIRGVEATKYTGQIDVRKALAAAEGQTGQEQKQAQQALEQLGVERIPFELYLDDQNRPVRMLQTIDAELGGQTLTTATTIDMFDWGTDVTIEAPDAADIVDAGAVPTAVPTAAA
jgi:hypothetical protein